MAFFQKLMLLAEHACKADQEVARRAMHAFFGREGWMEDVTDEAALKRSVRAPWDAKYPDAASLPKKIRMELGIHMPKAAKGGGEA